MKYLFVLSLFLIAPAASAFNPTTVVVDQPFEEILIPMGSEGQMQSYLGTLETYPHLYEFILEEPTTLEVRVRQRAEEVAGPVNLILLEVNPDTERISEIIRLNTPVIERNRDFVGSLGITVFESEWVAVELDAGIYRLEVSTPLNQSPYELDFGRESVANNYFGTFGTIWQVQRHFDYWWPRYLLSTYILYQIGIIIIAFGIRHTWRQRKQITDAA